MCVIFACIKGFPTEKQLELGAERNSDGAGVAFPVSRGVRWEKALDTKEVIEMVRKKRLSLPSIIHFRAASSGGKDPVLTHPFPVTEKVPLSLRGEAAMVLAHNGTWSGWETQLKETVVKGRHRLPGGKWSDTRALAWFVAHYGEGILSCLTGLRGDRIALLSKEEGLSLYGDWTDLGGGVNASNTWWIPTTTTYTESSTPFPGRSSGNSSGGTTSSSTSRTPLSLNPTRHFFDDLRGKWENTYPIGATRLLSEGERKRTTSILQPVSAVLQVLSAGEEDLLLAREIAHTC